jgi:hypothetical protein
VRRKAKNWSFLSACPSSAIALKLLNDFGCSNYSPLIAQHHYIHASSEQMTLLLSFLLQLVFSQRERALPSTVRSSNDLQVCMYQLWVIIFHLIKCERYSHIIHNLMFLFVAVSLCQSYLICCCLAICKPPISFGWWWWPHHSEILQKLSEKYLNVDYKNRTNM